MAFACADFPGWWCGGRGLACADVAALAVTNCEHRYIDHWWVPGLTIGYEHTFVQAIDDFLIG